MLNVFFFFFTAYAYSRYERYQIVDMNDILRESDVESSRQDQREGERGGEVAANDLGRLRIRPDQTQLEQNK